MGLQIRGLEKRGSPTFVLCLMTYFKIIRASLSLLRQPLLFSLVLALPALKLTLTGAAVRYVTSGTACWVPVLCYELKCARYDAWLNPHSFQSLTDTSSAPLTHTAPGTGGSNRKQRAASCLTKLTQRKHVRHQTHLEIKSMPAIKKCVQKTKP